jgi:Homeodomain-like domain-containing protein/HNH endonuclease
MFVRSAGNDNEVRTRERVAELLADGFSVMQAARVLGVTKSTVCYHKRRLGHAIDVKFNRRYDWEEVQRFYDLGHSISECQARFGFARQTFMDAAKRGDLVTRPHGAPIETYLVSGRRTNRTHLKLRLLSEGLKQNRCERCGIDSWLGEPLSMALHHINGDGFDNRLENLALLCPNCHAQTPNFSGRNRRIRRIDAAFEKAGATRLDRAAVRDLPVLGEAA